LQPVFWEKKEVHKAASSGRGPAKKRRPAHVEENGRAARFICERASSPYPIGKKKCF